MQQLWFIIINILYMLRASICPSSGVFYICIYSYIYILCTVTHTSNKILVWNVRIKTLKNPPTCFDLIQIIFRELVCSLLKSLVLKFVKNVKVNVVMRQHNIWCVYVRSVWRGVPEAYLSKQSARTHTKCYAAASPHWLLHF